MKHLTKPTRAIHFMVLAFLIMIGSQTSAATNAETIQYIFDKHEVECIAEQYEVRNAKEGETPEVTVDLKLDDDNIYEITIGSDGKTATVLHAEFSCTGIGYIFLHAPWFVSYQHENNLLNRAKPRLTLSLGLASFDKLSINGWRW